MLQDPLHCYIWCLVSQTITIMNLQFWSLFSYLGTTNYFRIHHGLSIAVDSLSSLKLSRGYADDVDVRGSCVATTNWVATLFIASPFTRLYTQLCFFTSQNALTVVKICFIIDFKKWCKTKPGVSFKKTPQKIRYKKKLFGLLAFPVLLLDSFTYDSQAGACWIHSS